MNPTRIFRKHYNKRAAKPPRPITQELIYNRSIPEPNSGCWLWLGAVGNFGHGQIRLNRKVVVASRASWIAFKGPIPDGTLVCHRCDLPGCVNPDHLFLGTHKDNTADMMRKGRNAYGPRYSGENNASAKLTNAEASFIRSFVPKEPGDMARLSKMFRVSNVTVHKIRTGRSWKQLSTIGAAK